MATGVTKTARRRISPRSLSKCQTERARKAKMISKSLFGMSNKAELKEHLKATGNESKASKQWEFDFDLGKPAKYQKNFSWEAMPCDEVPKVYHVNHIKRLYSHAQNKNFEGQLPKLRYYHHIKKVEPYEENNNKIISVKNQPITASSKKNGSNGQMKITDFLKEKKRPTVTTKKKN
ncbi:CLUMA_CG017806, isoform A [Clunio marinus]|uniref:CLUMA_CG017806, isoform A n=1 Tax=Clunio marinus TaxID=568069 RepID=A0A1J1IYH3_9DIPT|nr:CLUMA_CG017806, isoform A [Clunio marinus]